MCRFKMKTATASKVPLRITTVAIMPAEAHVPSKVTAAVPAGQKHIPLESGTRPIPHTVCDTAKRKGELGTCN